MSTTLTMSEWSATSRSRHLCKLARCVNRCQTADLTTVGHAVSTVPTKANGEVTTRWGNLPTARSAVFPSKIHSGHTAQISTRKNLCRVDRSSPRDCTKLDMFVFPGTTIKSRILRRSRASVMSADARLWKGFKSMQVLGKQDDFAATPTICSGGSKIIPRKCSRGNTSRDNRAEIFDTCQKKS